MKQTEFTVKQHENIADVRILPVIETETNGAEIYQIEVTFEDGGKPAKAEILWHEPMKGVLSFWTPSLSRDRSVKQWFSRRTCRSSLASGAPVFSLYEQDDTSALTAALSEAEHPMEMTACVNDFDEKEELDLSVIFEDKAPGSGTFSFCLRIDRRRIPMPEAVGAVTKWWEGFYPSLDQVENEIRTNERPLYSSWYACHQNPTQEVLEKEIKLAAKMGFKSMIIDDGWSYDGPGTGDYFDCGSWEVVTSKFPDFKGFMDLAHENGIKVALWFPVPFVGRNNADYVKYEDKLLRYDESMRAGVLDPRYPEVRQYIVGSYVDIVEKYGLDGLKLDFIDSFRAADGPAGQKSLSPKAGMDCETVEEGVNALLGMVRKEFTERNSDFMLEFRQSYVGPSIIRYGNMLRAGDCAFDPITNRTRIMDIRLQQYPLAVHADMFYWAKDEDPKVCARMLLNTLFSVPQISVLMANSSEDQLKVVENYIRWWDDHRQVLLHGQLTVKGMDQNYVYVSAEDEGLRIGAAYAAVTVMYDGKALTLFNASTEDMLPVKASVPGLAVIYDHMGQKVTENEVKVGLNALEIPVGGRADIR